MKNIQLDNLLSLESLKQARESINKQLKGLERLEWSNFWMMNPDVEEVHAVALDSEYNDQGGYYIPYLYTFTLTDGSKLAHDDSAWDSEESIRVRKLEDAIRYLAKPEDDFHYKRPNDLKRFAIRQAIKAGIIKEPQQSSVYLVIEPSLSYDDEGYSVNDAYSVSGAHSTKDSAELQARKIDVDFLNKVAEGYYPIIDFAWYPVQYMPRPQAEVLEESLDRFKALDTAARLEVFKTYMPEYLCKVKEFTLDNNERTLDDSDRPEIAA